MTIKSLTSKWKMNCNFAAAVDFSNAHFLTPHQNMCPCALLHQYTFPHFRQTCWVIKGRCKSRIISFGTWERLRSVWNRSIENKICDFVWMWVFTFYNQWMSILYSFVKFECCNRNNSTENLWNNNTLLLLIFISDIPRWV